MIRDTSVEIRSLQERWQMEIESRHARRNKIRYIDRLLNELEELNLADARAMPLELGRQVKRFFDDEGHTLSARRLAELSISETMEALYDIQDTLLLGGEEDDEL